MFFALFLKNVLSSDWGFTTGMTLTTSSLLSMIRLLEVVEVLMT